MASVRPLREGDDRGGFRSGDPDLDRYFHKYAGQNQFRRHVGVTYVLEEEGAILGFATVAPGSLSAEAMRAAAKRKLPGYPVPILRLARLAVDERAGGQGIGTQLLRYVFTLALKMSEELGGVGVVVDAKPAAVDFYRKFNFLPLDEAAEPPGSARGTVSLFAPLVILRRALE